MQRGIQYALYILLFVVVWSMEDTRPKVDIADAQLIQGGRIALCQSEPVADHFSIPDTACAFPVELSLQQTAPRTMIRLHHDIFTSESVFQLSQAQSCLAFFTASVPHPRPVDYYVYSLGHILI